MECDHVFKGHALGVTCMRCGLRMTTDEYMAYLGTPEKPEAPKKPKRARKPKEEPKHD